MSSSAAMMLQGAQQPRVSCVPRYRTTTGDRAIALAELAGLYLDPWQADILRHSLGRRRDQQWAAGSVGVMVSRQNGKGGLLEARELAGLFLLGDERLIIHSAHQYDTALEHFYRLSTLIEETPQLNKRLKARGGIMTSNGKESINLRDGSRLRLKARTTRGSGRGFSSDLLVLDEAMDLPETTMAAIISTLSARPNPQIWYTGSAVDQWDHDYGLAFARVRQRGLDGSDPRLAYFEWSLDFDDPDAVPDDVAQDLEALAQANPALGIRISPEFMETERRELSARSFAVERLGIGDWPAPEEDGESVIDLGMWGELLDAHSQVLDPVALAFDVAPDRSSASVAAAGRRTDDRRHVEVIAHRPGARWVIDYLAERYKSHRPFVVACDGKSPAAALVDELVEAGVPVKVLTSKEYAQACEQFVDTCEEDDLRHLGQTELDSAIKGAAKRELGDDFAWSRKKSSADITPLVAGTIALSCKPRVKPFIEVL